MRYCAFIRAINVGKHNRIRMDALRGLCAGVGLRDVSTYLQTGNVLFEADAEAEEIAVRLEGAFVEAGLRNAAAIVRSRAELGKLLEAAPLEAYPEPEFVRYVTLLREPLSAEAARGLVEAFPLAVPGAGEVCWPHSEGQPYAVAFTAFLEKKQKLQVTTRYWRVVEEAARLLGSG